MLTAVWSIARRFPNVGDLPDTFMQMLYLMRHGKSSWDTPGLTDRERPLLPKGIERTEKRARELRDNGVELDAIWTSDAVRAAQTAEIVRNVLGLQPENVFVEPMIYDADHVNDLRRVVLSIPDEFETVLLVGHNPLITELARLLTRNPLDEMKTSQIVAVEMTERNQSTG